MGPSDSKRTIITVPTAAPARRSLLTVDIIFDHFVSSRRDQVDLEEFHKLEPAVGDAPIWRSTPSIV